ncbi:MAG: hypothetical protein KGI49_01380 [Patescibacteria group bacterium]|nr:hypothetical protein [Patescibacteria group bacterium]
MKTKYWCWMAWILVILSLILVLIFRNSVGQRLPGLAFWLMIMAMCLTAVITAVVYVAKSKRGKKKDRKWTKVMTVGILTIVIPVAVPMSLQASQGDVMAGFKLASAEGDYVLTPIDGGPSITMPVGSVSINKEGNVISTPDGDFHILNEPSGAILFRSSDGTIYTANPQLALCVVVLVVIAVGIIGYAGCQAYRCATNIIDNYTNQMGSNMVIASAVSVRTGAGSGMFALPTLANLSTNAADGQRLRQTMILPTGCSLTLSNMEDKEWIANLDSGTTNVFGDLVPQEFLLQIDPTNSFMTMPDGDRMPCCLQASTNMVDWRNVTLVVLAWPGMAYGSVASLTTVTLTSKADGLRPYATNWLQFAGDQVVFSNSLDGPPIIGSERCYLRLAKPLP